MLQQFLSTFKVFLRAWSRNMCEYFQAFSEELLCCHRIQTSEQLEFLEVLAVLEIRNRLRYLASTLRVRPDFSCLNDLPCNAF